FSCGEIDGRYGQNLKNAIEAYQLANQLRVDGVVGPSLWQLLNQDSADAVILVPNVITPHSGRAASVVVTGLATKDPIRAASVEALDSAGKVLFYATANIGGAHDPLPVGRWKVTDIVHNPWYNYNPGLFWDAENTNAKVKIPPGPNGPVGVVWIGISKPHYGLHGASDPGLIGRTHSDGCVRMTNWDALELAKLVEVGTPMIMKEAPGSP